MKRPIDIDFDTIREYMVAMEAYVEYLESKKEPLDVIYYQGALVEDDEYCFDAHVLLKNGNIWEGTMSVEFKDKKKDLTEHWDNEMYFRNVVFEDEYVLRQLSKSLNHSGQAMFIDFLEELEDKGWF